MTWVVLELAGIDTMILHTRFLEQVSLLVLLQASSGVCMQQSAEASRPASLQRARCTIATAKAAGIKSNRGSCRRRHRRHLCLLTHGAGQLLPATLPNLTTCPTRRKGAGFLPGRRNAMREPCFPPGSNVYPAGHLQLLVVVRVVEIGRAGVSLAAPPCPVYGIAAVLPTHTTDYLRPYSAHSMLSQISRAHENERRAPAQTAVPNHGGQSEAA